MKLTQTTETMILSGFIAFMIGILFGLVGMFYVYSISDNFIPFTLDDCDYDIGGPYQEKCIQRVNNMKSMVSIFGWFFAVIPIGVWAIITKWELRTNEK